MKVKVKKTKIKDKTQIKKKKSGKTINKKNIKNIANEFNEIDIIAPKDKKRKILAIILKENGSIVWKWVPKRLYRFSHDENTYFITRGNNYISDNNISCSIYFEGIPVAMTHRYIETEQKTRHITTLAGENIDVTLPVIKGVKIDSKTVDFVLNRGFADEFTQTKAGFGSTLQTILLIICILSIVVVGILVKT